MKRGYVEILKNSKVPLWKKAGPLLPRLDIELTERCNNSCVHCCLSLPKDDPSAKKKELTFAEISAILKEAVSLGCLSVRYTGGEPLLRNDFPEIYISTRKLGLRVLLFTNATLISPELVKLFCAIPPLEKIEVTFYGASSDSYEAVTRVPGSFARARRGMNLLLKHRIPFLIKGVVLPMNRQDLLRIERWAKDIPAMDFPPSQTVFLNLHQHRKQKKNCLIKKLRIDPEEGAGILARNPNLYLKDMKEFCARFIGPTGNRIFTCGSGFRSGCVDAYGYFWPCMQLRSPSLAYDLKKGSLKDALLNFFPKLRKIRTTNKEYLLRCGRCFLRGLCQQCPGISWLETGKLDTPVEYFCQAAHSQARLLGLIEKGELAWEVENWKDRVARLSQIEFLKFN